MLICIQYIIVAAPVDVNCTATSVEDCCQQGDKCMLYNCLTEGDKNHTGE